MPAAALRHVQHGGPHFDLNTWLGFYKWNTFGVLAGITDSIRIDQSNEPQPDLVLFIAPGFGGQARLDDEGYVDGSPELALEIAASSASIDLGAKFKSYCRHGVQEYLVWRVLDEAIDWFRLRGDHYERLVADAQGVLKSEVFPGLWLDPAAMIREDVARIQEVLQQGIADPAHAAFGAKLRAAKAGS